MKFIKTLTVSLFVIVIISVYIPKTNAQVTVPHPFVDFSAIFVSGTASCVNGLLIEILAPMPLILIVPYVPITPLVPVFKLWGPIPGSSTVGNFLLGGVCLTTASGGTVAVPVIGTVVQIGTTAAPTPWYFPITFF